MARMSAETEDGVSIGIAEDPPRAGLAWPPPGALRARKPDGGFIDCPVDYLTLPWWVYKQGTITLQTLRVWFGTLELVEKRCTASPDVPAHYGPEELRRLLRLSRLPPVTDAIERLEDLGLLAWSPHAILFLPHAYALKAAVAQDSYRTLRSHIATWLRWVPVPRRLLVWLAQDGQPGLIATVLGVLLRCIRYKAHQCISGGRVAVPWIAAVFGVAERTVQRAMQTLEDCGWLARLALQPAREHPHGRYTIINLSWQRPGATSEAQLGRQRATPVCDESQSAPAPCQHLSPLKGAWCQNLSPSPTRPMPLTPENIERSADGTGGSFQPFQEERQDPEPAPCGPSEVSIQDAQNSEQPSAESDLLSDDESITAEDYAAAAARLIAQGCDPAFLIRPVVLAEVQRACEETPCSATAVSTSTVAPASEETRESLVLASLSSAGPPEASAARSMPPATLREVTLADLLDVGRLGVLHQQACARGWLRSGEAERLNVVAAAVHAQRVGHDPCRLFVALLRDRRWEVITQEDEDRARQLLREHADGPRRRAALACDSVVPMPDDARFVLLAQEVLHQVGWQGDPSWR